MLQHKHETGDVHFCPLFWVIVLNSSTNKKGKKISKIYISFLFQSNHILTKCYADMQEITKGIDHVQDSVRLVEKYKTGYCPPSDILKDEDPFAKQKTVAVKHGKGGKNENKWSSKLNNTVFRCNNASAHPSVRPSVRPSVQNCCWTTPFDLNKWGIS